MFNLSSRRGPVVMVFLLSLILSLVYVVPSTAQEKRNQLARTPYVDPDGFFTIVPPAGWRVQGYPDDPRGKVAFFGPQSVDLRVLVNSVDFRSIEDLLAFCRTAEKRLGISTNIVTVTFDGRPAVQRTFARQGVQFRYINFLVENADHNLAYSAPTRLYEQYLPVVQKSMATYEPRARQMSDTDARAHYLAKKRRVARLFMDDGSLDLALRSIEEGLAVAPADEELIQLKTRVERLRQRVRESRLP